MSIKGRRRDYTEVELREIVRRGLRNLPLGRSAGQEIENILAIQEVSEESMATARGIATDEYSKMAREPEKG